MKIFKKQQENHKTIWKDGFITGVSTGNKKKIRLVTSHKLDPKSTIIHPLYNEYEIINSTIKLPYEALIPLFSLGGHEVRVLLFIIGYCADKDTGFFIWNNEVAEQYMTYYQTITSKETKTETVRQAIITLVKHNVIQKQKKNHYVLNPLYASKPNNYKIEQRINSFTKKFVEAGRSIAEALSFTPPSKK